MTMIELVAALALFVVIFGILLLALNAATNLWDNSRAQRRELPAAEHIADLIADDLYQATVADTNDYPVFILETPPAKPEADIVYTVLALIRPAPFRTPVPISKDRRSLDAIFYTYYNDTLFRHAIPLEIKYSDTGSIGQFIHDIAQQQFLTPANHDTILKYSRGENNTYPSGLLWQWQVLAERTDIILKATIPHALIRIDGDARYPNTPLPTTTTDPALHLPPVPVEKLYSDILPDQVDILLRLCDEQDWSVFAPIRDQDTPEANYTKSHLGTLISRRVTLPQAGGSRLP
jgi:hypothetical protein